MKPALLVALLAMPSLAQNSDLAVLLGGSPQNKSLKDLSLRQANQGSVQINYAWQWREGPAGRLYVEMPVVVIGGASDVINSSFVGAVGARAFYVPGLRYQYSLTPRVSLYSAGGAGMQVHHLKLGLSGGAGGGELSLHAHALRRGRWCGVRPPAQPPGERPWRSAGLRGHRAISQPTPQHQLADRICSTLLTAMNSSLFRRALCAL